MRKRTHASASRSNGSYRRMPTDKAFIRKCLVIYVALCIISAFTFGILVTAVLALTMLIIFLLAQVLDKRRKGDPKRRLVKVVAVLMLASGIIGIAAFILFFGYIAATAPKFDTKKLNNGETTIIYDGSGKTLTTIGNEKRENISFNDIPAVLVDSIIATEDSRYFQHHGFDAPRFMKALSGQLRGQNAGGASTLTMQVVKNTFTSTEQSGIKGIIRKFTDIYLAVFKMEKKYSKEEIMEFYVNGPYLGSSSYGVEQASMTYFNKSAKDMNLAEASLVAGLFQAPNAYDPKTSPELAEKRRATVLNLMVHHGYITEEEAEIAKSIPVKSLVYNNKTNSASPYQGYIDTVVSEVVQETKLDPYQVPMKIYTNMDKKKQDGLNDVFDGKSYKWTNKAVQSGVVAIDTHNGNILAVGAGRHRTGERTYNYATEIKRQPGSTAKPLFDYGPFFEFNNGSTYTLVTDAPYTYSDGTKINNWDSGYQGKMTVRKALARSRNIPALKIFQKVDNAKIISFVQGLGIEPEISDGYIHEAHSIGGFNGVSPMQLAAAYSAFANGGTYYKPHSVSKVILRDSKEEIKFNTEGSKAMSDSTAYMITDILKGGVNSGDIGVARVSGVNLAGKTGTTNYDTKTRAKFGLPRGAVPDAWIVGYSPDIAIGMWYGYEKTTSKHYMTMSQASYQRKILFKAISNAIFDKNNNNWKRPSSVVKICVEMGSDPVKKVSANTPSSRKVCELFKKGTEPTEVSSAYKELSNVSGLDYTINGSTVTISWNKLNTPDEASKSDGDFGYEVYQDGKYLGFTTNNYYTVNIGNGTFKFTIKTSYSKTKSNKSSGVSVTVSNEAKKEEEPTEEEPTEPDDSGSGSGDGGSGGNSGNNSGNNSGGNSGNKTP